MRRVPPRESQAVGRLPYRLGLFGILLGGAIVRVGYLASQPLVDPTFSSPSMDAQYYWSWAQSWAAGATGPSGAFYLAPLYPWLLSWCMRQGIASFAAVFAVQHVATLLSAFLAGSLARRCAGPVAGLATTALLTFHATFLFFASRAVGETLAILLLLTALTAITSSQRWFGGIGGGALGALSALARPNLLLVPLVSTAIAWAARRRAAATGIVVGLVLTILPVAIRNYRVSGEFVPISANAGLTAYHGNGPGAKGTFQLPDGFSGAIERQQAEATRFASRALGRSVDPVEADRYWGGEALRTRLANPWDSLVLVGRRALLLVDNHEHGLDEHPTMDRNPWRLRFRLPWTLGAGAAERPAEWAIVPFALIFALALGGLLARGVSGSGGAQVWGAIGACAVAPLAFYVSSRYRLPLTAVLVIPAGAAIAWIAERPELGRRRTGWTVAAMAGALVVSLTVPSEDVQRTALISGHFNRAAAYKSIGDFDAAERDARQALAIGPEIDTAWYNLATILEARERFEEAEAAYLGALERNPAMTVAAGNLASLYIRLGTPEKAPPIVRGALEHGAGDSTCWTNLIVAHWELGQTELARRAAAEALASGIPLDPELLAAIEVVPARP